MAEGSAAGEQWRPVAIVRGPAPPLDPPGPATVHRRVDDLVDRAPLDSDLASTQQWLVEADRLVRGDVADLDRARLLECRAIVRSYLVAPDRSHAAASHADAVEAARLYESCGEVRRAATSYATAATGAAQVDDVATALENAVRALLAFDAVPGGSADPLAEARLANSLGMLCYQLFDYARAVEFYADAAAHTLRVGDRQRWSIATYNVAEALVHQARHLGRELPSAAGAQAREQVLARAEALAARLVAEAEPAAARLVDAPRLLADVLCEQGRAEQAWPMLEAAGRAAGDPPGRGQAGALHLVRGRCLHLLGRHDEALAELDAAIEVGGEDYDVAEHMGAVELRSLVRERVGDLPGALADARRVGSRSWARHRRQIATFVGQLWSRAGAEGKRRDLEVRAADLLRTAEQDTLTGLANRRSMERFLGQLPDAGSACLVLVDVDHFKEVNDRFGHVVGDEVLRQVAGLLGRGVRTVDHVARWGGEEFLVVLPGGSAQLGVEAATRLLQRVEDHPWAHVRPGLTLTVSAGVARGDVADLDDVLYRADAALYAAKRAGRNRVRAAISAAEPDAFGREGVRTVQLPADVAGPVATVGGRPES
jgi:diguanylate cyclase (GGDEF)-like protein